MIKRYWTAFNAQTEGMQTFLGALVAIGFVFLLVFAAIAGSYATDRMCGSLAKAECVEQGWRPTECRDHVCASCDVGCSVLLRGQ